MLSADDCKLIHFRRYSNSLFVMLNQRVVLNKATSNVHLHSSSNEMTQRHAAAVDFGAHNDNMAHRNQHETVFIRVDKTTMRDGDVERTMAANLVGLFLFELCVSCAVLTPLW